MGDTTSEIRAMVQRFSEGYQSKDTEGLVALVTDDCQLVGTGADEVRFGREGFRAQAERDFSQADEVSMTIDGLRVIEAGDAAFAYGDVTVAGSAGGQSFSMSGLRTTLGFVRTSEGWRMAQMHLSVPDNAQTEGSSFEE